MEIFQMIELILLITVPIIGLVYCWIEIKQYKKKMAELSLAEANTLKEMESYSDNVATDIQIEHHQKKVQQYKENELKQRLADAKQVSEDNPLEN